MAYSQDVIDHYENPRNVGRFDENNNDVGTGLVGAPACGDVMRLQIKVEDGIITDAKFKTYGCLTSNAPVNTPTCIKKIKDLSPELFKGEVSRIADNYIMYSEWYKEEY